MRLGWGNGGEGIGGSENNKRKRATKYVIRMMPRLSLPVSLLDFILSGIRLDSQNIIKFRLLDHDVDASRSPT